MKRALILLVALLLAIPLALGVMAGLAYYGTLEAHIPTPAVTMLDQSVRPAGYSWRSPVFGGLIHRDFVREAPARIPDIGEMNGSHFNLTTPDGYEATATLTLMGETVWSGRASELPAYEFIDNGRYRIEVECARPAQGNRGYGTLYYQSAFTVAVDPRYEASDDWVTQGDVLAVRMYNLSGSMQPHIESDLGEVYLMATRPGQATAYIPMGHDLEPGSYVVYGEAGGIYWEIPFRVTDGGFSNHHVESEAGKTWPENASDAPEEYADYQEQILPLLIQRDDTRYWEGVFTPPALGSIAAEYGTYTYVDDSATPYQHPGIDIEAPLGAEVTAAGNGRVVFAAQLDSTGNTVVIEHGGGLKSLYFHLDSLNVQPNDRVAQGDVIGAVGSTGVCAQPHLHFEMRLDGATLNPTQLLNGTSRLYYFD